MRSKEFQRELIRRHMEGRQAATGTPGPPAYATSHQQGAAPKTVWRQAGVMTAVVYLGEISVAFLLANAGLRLRGDSETKSNLTKSIEGAAPGATRRGRPAICPGLWFENPAVGIARPAAQERTSANPGRLAHRHPCAAFGPSGPTPGQSDVSLLPVSFNPNRAE